MRGSSSRSTHSPWRTPWAVSSRLRRRRPGEDRGVPSRVRAGGPGPADPGVAGALPVGRQAVQRPLHGGAGRGAGRCRDRRHRAGERAGSDRRDATRPDDRPGGPVRAAPGSPRTVARRAGGVARVTAFQGDGAGGDEAEAGAGPMEAPAARDRYDVRLSWGDDGWAVEVVESAGPGVDVVVFARACAGEAEARTFAST